MQVPQNPGSVSRPKSDAEGSVRLRPLLVTIKEIQETNEWVDGHASRRIASQPSASCYERDLGLAMVALGQMTNVHARLTVDALVMATAALAKCAHRHG